MNFLEKMFVGEKGEQKVEKILKNLLKDNIYIKKHFQIPTNTSSKEIDLLMFHPAFGIFVIEVKNYSNPDYISEEHFEQAKEYKNIILSMLNDKLKHTRLSINFKVIYPNLSKTKAKAPFGYENHALFKEDLENLNKLFLTTNNYIPSDKELEIITETLNIKAERIPVISHDSIEFFDQKQLSALNSYKGGFRLIRGVAGSGKSILLKNFANIKKDKKILVLAFNRAIIQKLKNEINNPNAEIYTLFTFLKKAGLNLPSKLDDKFNYLKNNVEHVYSKIKAYQKNENFDYLLVDEAQDMEAGVLRSLIESFENSLIFIDEAQKFYEYSLNNFYEVTKHPSFKEEISLKGRRTIALKNIYRTPSNIAKCAIEIIQQDKTIHNYYKSIKFIYEDFNKDIKFLLQNGKLNICKIDEKEIEKIISQIPKNESYIILTHEKHTKEKLEKKFKNVKTISSVKGLDADHVIVDDFYNFLLSSSKSDIFFRKIYVILTRPKKKIYLDLPTYENTQSKNIQTAVNIIKRYQSQNNETEKHSLQYNMQIKEAVKKSTEVFIKTGEIVSAITAFAGLLSL